MEYLKLSNIKNLKELSWYLTIPILTSAATLQNIINAPIKNKSNFFYILDWLSFVGEYFVIISISLLLFFVIYLLVSGWLEILHNFPFTLIIATTILSFATVGLVLHIAKPENVLIPLNIFWFFGFIALSFNLYQLESDKTT